MQVLYMGEESDQPWGPSHASSIRKDGGEASTGVVQAIGYAAFIASGTADLRS